MEINLLYLSAVVAIVAYLYHLLTRNNDYFHEKPIPSLAVRPILGSTGRLMLRRCTFYEYIGSIYNKFPNVKVFGLFDTATPFFVIRDPELLKRIAVKDFDHFVDHRPIFGDSVESDNPHALFGNSLFAMNGQRWKDMRATLSPAFTGSKMRLMFKLVLECCQNSVQYYEQKIKSNGSMEVELKDMLARLATDVIGSCAFGLKMDSFKDPLNEFLKNGKMMIQFSRLSVLAKIMALRIFPKIFSRFGLDMIDREHAIYFSKVIKETIQSRESQGIVRHDMIDLLLQARKGVLKYQPEKEVREGFATVQESEVGQVQVSKTMTETELIAQCMLFFVGGFDTVSTTAMFLFYELVRNPEVQEKLYQEILKTEQTLAGKALTYDVLQTMTYMDMVVSESLRIWPPAPALDRMCVHDYPFNDGEGLKFTIDKGSCVWFPVYGLHHDPKYYPQPEKFIPERFSDENKTNINLGAYLPFGIGPRNCIASRFALMEVKAIVYFMLLKFSFGRSINTHIPLRLKKGFANLGTEDGKMFLQFKLRNSA